jgi:hypothetical protein
MKNMSNEDRMMFEDIIRYVVKRIIKLKYGDDYSFREDPEDVYINLFNSCMCTYKSTCTVT